MQLGGQGARAAGLPFGPPAHPPTPLPTRCFPLLHLPAPIPPPPPPPAVPAPRRKENLAARAKTKSDNKKAKREKKLLRAGFEGRKAGFIQPKGK